MDAEEQQLIEAEQMKIEEERKLSLRNQALQLELERVKNIPIKFIPSASNDVIEELIEKQMLDMLYSDAIDYPI